MNDEEIARFAACRMHVARLHAVLARTRERLEPMVGQPLDGIDVNTIREIARALATSEGDGLVLVDAARALVRKFEKGEDDGETGVGVYEEILAVRDALESLAK